jgi:hypothetical protein
VQSAILSLQPYKTHSETLEARDARRPTFNESLNELPAMKFKLTANVNSSKFSKFAQKGEDWEQTNDILTVLAH